MFGKIIDKIVIEDFDNYGVVFERDGKYYNENTLEEIGIEDNKGNYFFAIKSQIDYEQYGCSEKKVTQNYIFKFISQCSYTSWLLNQILNLTLVDIDPVSNASFIIKSFNEEYIKEKLITNTFDIDFFGDINDCIIEKPCCC